MNRTTGLLVDGHLRVKLAVKRGENSIPVSYVELTEAEEEMVLATLDPIVGMARADREKQEEINERVREGVGGERAALRALLEAETARSGKGEKPRHEITAELLESHNYVVLYFDNDLDWNVAQQVLGIEPKEALDSREGYRRAGIGRVIRGAPVIERLQGGGTDADNDDAG